MQSVDDIDFQKRLSDIHSRIVSSCARVGRDASEVTLVAVSKTFPPETIDSALRAGVSVFGENKVQEAIAKAQLTGSAQWHLIGRLQTNKVRQALSLFTVIHSVDSIKLIDAIHRVQEETGLRPQIMLEINVGEENSKIGFTPETVMEAVEHILELGFLNFTGLMAIPPWAPTAEMTRPSFVKLRETRDKISEKFNISLPDLSMGMSSDYEVAIEEGSTFIRVGTALFGNRQAWKPIRSQDSDDYFV